MERRACRGQTQHRRRRMTTGVEASERSGNNKSMRKQLQHLMSIRLSTCRRPENLCSTRRHLRTRLHPAAQGVKESPILAQQRRRHSFSIAIAQARPPHLTILPVETIPHISRPNKRHDPIHRRLLQTPVQLLLHHKLPLHQAVNLPQKRIKSTAKWLHRTKTTSNQS